VRDRVRVKIFGRWESVEPRLAKNPGLDRGGPSVDFRLVKNAALEGGGAASGRKFGPREVERRLKRPRLGGGVGGPSVCGVGGGLRSGLYVLIEHQFLRLSRRLLFLGLPVTSWVNIGIMSSSVSASR
jgi:hypothetical protein